MAPPAGGTRTSLSVQARFQTQGFGGGNTVFGPGTPLLPPDQMPVRYYDFAVGENRVQAPRAYEPFGFASLRAFANVELVRMAIETRKDQIERLGWRVRSKDEKKPKRGAEGRIRAAETLLRRPDGETDFATWLRAVLEDLFVLDAPAIERRRTLGGQLIGLDYVQGDTIKVLVDETGRRPKAPLPAFQQIIKGRVWNDLTAADLIYRPRNVRTNHLYGFGPVEQIVVTINTVLQRQARQLAWFTDGNTPPGIINAPEGWSPDQLKQYQDWFDARTQTPGGRSQLIWGPAGAAYKPFKDPPLKDEFDEWLARIVCYAFNLPPTPFIRQMNRATGETDAERALEEGLEPTKLWAKRLFDGIVQDDLGFDDLEFDWVVTRDIDPKVQAEIEDLALRNGSSTIDEVRDSRGQQPLPGGVGSHPMVYVKDGVVKLDDALRASAAGATAAEKLAAAPAADPNAPKPEDGQAPRQPEKDEAQ